MTPKQVYIAIVVIGLMIVGFAGETSPTPPAPQPKRLETNIAKKHAAISRPPSVSMLRYRAQELVGSIDDAQRGNTEAAELALNGTCPGLSETATYYIAHLFSRMFSVQAREITQGLANSARHGDLGEHLDATCEIMAREGRES